jgi:enterochelin esterase-like enzyme
MSDFFTTEISEQTGDNLRFITVKSNALKKRVDITVFVPPNVSEIAGVVILLHGVYGSHWAWTMKGRVHETAQKLIDTGQIKPMLLVMPSDGLFADGSAYLPHKTEDYEKWIVEDVIALVKEQFDLVHQNTPFFITGLSMGGYGALRLGAKYSHLFKAFSGLSSITEFSQMKLFVEDFMILENSVSETTGVLDEMLLNKDNLSPFRFDCGTEDILVEANRKLHNQLIDNNIGHTYGENEGGHQWEYWQRYITDSLVFFNEYTSCFAT